MRKDLCYTLGYLGTLRDVDAYKGETFFIWFNGSGFGRLIGWLCCTHSANHPLHWCPDGFAFTQCYTDPGAICHADSRGYSHAGLRAFYTCAARGGSSLHRFQARLSTGFMEL